MPDDTGLGRVVLGLDAFALTEVEPVGGEACLHVETEPNGGRLPRLWGDRPHARAAVQLGAGSAGGRANGGAGAAQAGEALSRACVRAGDVDRAPRRRRPSAASVDRARGG